LPDVEGALRELEYRLDVLKLDCVVLFSNARGIYLGDACVRPLFAELERHAVVVFVHPTASPDAAARTLGLPDSLIDFTTDTTGPVAQLHYGDTSARTPSVSYIFSHVGGTIPYLATRFSIVDAMRVIPGAEERGTRVRLGSGWQALQVIDYKAPRTSENGLKIRVSAVRFCPWPPFRSETSDSAVRVVKGETESICSAPLG